MKIRDRIALILGVVVTFMLAGCNNNISRTGEVQFSTTPVPDAVMLLSPSLATHIFYVSHVHGMYVTEGDIVVDTDARKLSHQKVLVAVQSGKSEHFDIKPSTSLKSAMKITGSQKIVAELGNLETKGFYLPANTTRKVFGLYLPANPAASAYAYSPPRTGYQGSYLPTLAGRWHGTIPYCVSARLDMHDSVVQAVSIWHNGTGLAFSEKPAGVCAQYETRVPPAGIIWFIPGDGCDSYVGRLPDIANTIHLNVNCADVGGIVHEIGHALGLFHEQDRPDRNNYVRILSQNVLPGYISQFNADPRQPEAEYGKYDCDSIMQYPRWAFQKEAGLDTIQPIPGKGCDGIGQRNGPSPEDFSEVKFMYSLKASPHKAH